MRVWIEIESPYCDDGETARGRTKEEADLIGQSRAAHLSRLLKRMGILSDYPGEIVWWDQSEKQRGYAWTRDEAGGFVWANDHGQWYNLEYLGRP